jgi:hypothetical protein
LLRAYLAAHQIPCDAVNETGPNNQSPKPFYNVILDDRAVRFTGNWDQAMEDVLGVTVPGIQKSDHIADAGNMVYLHVPLTRIPKEMHPAGLFKAGSTEYEIIHEGDEALVVNGSFDDLFKAIQDEVMIEEIEKELT